MDTITEIGQVLLQAVLPLLASILVAYGVALVKANIGRINDEKLRLFLERVVEAAEQSYGPGRGDDKKEYVLSELEGRGLKVSDADIEAAVWNLWVPPVETPTPITETEDIS